MSDYFHFSIFLRSSINFIVLNVSFNLSWNGNGFLNSIYYVVINTVISVSAALPAAYAFSRYTMKASFLIIKSYFLKESMEIDKPKIDKETFWICKIKSYGPKFYQNYSYPEKYFIELEKISFYCKENNISLLFWIPPNYIEIQNLIDYYNLSDENEKFIHDIAKLGKFHNFNIPNKLTKNKLNFTDPTHFNDDVGEYIYNILFNVN